MKIERVYAEILYINTQIYCLIDIIWILFDQKVRISKTEIIGHHIITLSLLSENTEPTLLKSIMVSF